MSGLTFGTRQAMRGRSASLEVSFTEGIEARGLVEAKALLETLG